MDDLKDAGASWDEDNDTGHYVNLLDDGTIAGAVSLRELPKDREAYDTALRAKGTDEYKQGYLPYAILDGWQQLRKDFANWRADDYAGARCDEAVEQQLIVRDLGVWGHFVGDGSQPLHVTVHFNGWGDYANPNGYTQSHQTHSVFESEFVDRYVTSAEVSRYASIADNLPAPHTLLSQQDVMAEIARYLLATNAAVPQLYDIEKAGGFNTGSPQAIAFAAQRLGAGAAELRDLAIWAWEDSANDSVGYPAERVSDIVSGKARWPVITRPCAL